jgi:hypothetical protein
MESGFFKRFPARLGLNSEVEDRKYVVLFLNQQSDHFQANFVEVGLILLKALKPKETGKIGRTNIGIEVRFRSTALSSL